MAHINFLEPPRFSLRQFNLKNFELNYLWMMVIGGALLLVMMVYGMVQQRRISSLNKDLTAAMATVKRGGKPAKPGAPQKPTLTDAFLQRVQWAPILNAIANSTPDTISLNYIKGSALGSRSVQIEGVGADVLAAARYEDVLAKVPFFSKVDLLSSGEKGGSKAGVGKGDVKAEAKSDAKSATAAAAAATGNAQLTFEIQGWLK